jgi:hypothetical protein
LLQPRLLIFGFDQAQKSHAGWQIHRERLVNGLSEGSVLSMGDPGHPGMLNCYGAELHELIAWQLGLALVVCGALKLLTCG